MQLSHVDFPVSKHPVITYIMVSTLLLCAALCCMIQPGTAANCLSLKAHDRKQFKGKELLSTGPGHILQPEGL
jgi:hypothetical protein